MERETSSVAFVLPPQIVGMADVMRLKRELELLYEYLHQAALRQADAEQVKLPRTSRLLDELVSANKLDLLHRSDYERTMAELELIEQRAPKLHLSFSTDPSAAFMIRIVEWLRRNVHPLVLVQIGLQPTLAAGCMVRSTNKQFDLSLKQHFAAARPLLLEKLEQASAQPAVAPQATEAQGAVA